MMRSGWQISIFW